MILPSITSHRTNEKLMSVLAHMDHYSMGCRVGGELTAPYGDHVDEDGIITSYF